MKAIILAAGTGSSLFPITFGTSKQLLPVYDKPMIYYPLSVLMLAGIRDILIITTPKDNAAFINLLGNGSQFGLNLQYAIQQKAEGLGQAFIIGKDFIGQDEVALILGDNIFYGQSFSEILCRAVNKVSVQKGALIFGYSVKNPESYGVIEFDEKQNPVSIIEKPKTHISNFAVPGLYFYDNSVIQIAQNVKPSSRGELEITDVNNEYLKQNKMQIQLLGRGMCWLDTGTPDRLLEASNYIATIQKRQGFYVSCPEEIAYSKKWISREQLLENASKYKNEYGEYLRYIAG